MVIVMVMVVVVMVVVVVVVTAKMRRSAVHVVESAGTDTYACTYLALHRGRTGRHPSPPTLCSLSGIPLCTPKLKVVRGVGVGGV